MTSGELHAWLGLSLTRGLGDTSFRALLAAFGGPEQIYAAPRSKLSQYLTADLSNTITRGINRERIDSTLAWLENSGNHLITLADSDYPQRLLEIPDPPPLIYLKGRRELLNRPGLAIVGSRNATPQGLLNAEAFAQNLAEAGLTIISGLATGIDAAAHKGSLKGKGGTIAVVGTGLDIIYPARNKTLAHAIVEHGAIISEFPLGTPSIAGNFPRRNRIISGMSNGCLVVEAAVQSGSLITARLAAEQGREVFAIPGSIHSPVARGCHALIKQGAKLVEAAQDILDELNLSGIRPADARVEDNNDPLWRAMGFDPASFDVLAQRSGLTAPALCAMLLERELLGQIAKLPGGLYQRIVL
ncbi:MAG TPA: DNA-processing protein DprA [Burkholderiales bacterium]|nr:DNA-processing protein DprA [Burkholderiales bacterium]